MFSCEWPDRKNPNVNHRKTPSNTSITPNLNVYWFFPSLVVLSCCKWKPIGSAEHFANTTSKVRAFECTLCEPIYFSRVRSCSPPVWSRNEPNEEGPGENKRRIIQFHTKHLQMRRGRRRGTRSNVQQISICTPKHKLSRSQPSPNPRSEHDLVSTLHI